jgi:eukaryotic-like serine/threonine-protein kinase
MAISPGAVIGERYRILGRVGAGAHGVVFRARDLETREQVALKFLGDGKLDPEYKRRVEREALAMARLRGTNAVYVHALNLTDDGSPYVVMELLEGTDFERFLRRAEKSGGRLKRARLLEILRPVVDTLEAAHQRRIIHRDLKPSNIFLVSRDAGGGVRLLDFGLVKMLGLTTLTADGMIAGTPSYIAPEAWTGDPRRVDHRVDVYALGVVVFRALSGRLPTPSRDMLEICRWATSGARPSLRALRPKLPGAIDGWIVRALAVRPDERFPGVRAMWSALERILARPEQSPF